jgi:hypothetical protein
MMKKYALPMTGIAAIAAIVVGLFVVDFWSFVEKTLFGYDYGWQRLWFNLAFFVVALGIGVTGILILWLNRTKFEVWTPRTVFLLLLYFIAIILGPLWAVATFHEITACIKFLQAMGQL